MGFKKIIEAVGDLTIAIRMTKERHAQLFRRLIVRKETRMIDVAPANIWN